MPDSGSRQFIADDGARIAYCLHRAPHARLTLVLIHGLASNMSRWAEFVRSTALRESCNLLRIDLRGQGGSVFRGAAGMREWIADIAGILGTEDVAQAVLVGHCLGANIALRFAAANPGMTCGLVLIEPMPRDALSGVLRAAGFIRLPVLGAARAVRALNALGLYRRSLVTLDLEVLDRDARAALAAGDSGKQALKDFASPFADLRSMPLAAYLQGLAALLEPQPELVKLRLPVLVLSASRSGFTDREHSREILSRLPDAEFRELPALHWIPTETPQAMRTAIEEWIDRRFP